MSRRTVFVLVAFVAGVALGALVFGARKPAPAPSLGELRSLAVNYPTPPAAPAKEPRQTVRLVVYRVLEAGEVTFDRDSGHDIGDRPDWRIEIGPRVYYAVAE